MITLTGETEQREEDPPIGVRAHLDPDLALELLDLRVQRPDHRHEREDQLATSGELKLADASPRALRSLAINAVDAARPSSPLVREGLHTGDPETARIGWAGVALEEREQDLGVHVAEQSQRSGPEQLEPGGASVERPAGGDSSSRLGSTRAAPWSDQSQAPAPGTGGCRCGRARRARTR